MKHIRDLVDIHKWPYVCPYNLVIRTPWGDVRVPKGWLSDGASGPGIIDLEEEAFVAHDRMYVFPEINGKDGEPHKVGKITTDLIYGYILLKKLRILHAITRPNGLIWFPLTAPISWKIWFNYRKKEKEKPGYWHDECMVPHAACWEFPNWHTEYAVWRGVEVEE